MAILGSDATRRAATMVGLAGGGLGALAAAGYGVLRAEASLARRTIGQPFGSTAPNADGWFEAPGCDRVATPLRLVILGDSGAAGLGCEHGWQTPGALLATGLAEVSGRRVLLRSYAVVGAESPELPQQLGMVLPQPGDAEEVVVEEPFAASVAIVVIGGNDVVSQMRVAVSARHLAQAVSQLRDGGFEVVVGTCPDLGTIRPVAQPLRALARRMSRSLASAQTVAAVSAGARTVSLGDLLGPVFDADPETLFSSDRFHPSATGYARMVEAVLPTACAAAGYPFAVAAERAPRGPVEPVAKAAAEAVENAGSEVSPALARGQRHGPLGRWAVLRRRSQISGAHHVDARIARQAWQDAPAQFVGQMDKKQIDTGVASAGTTDISEKESDDDVG